MRVQPLTIICTTCGFLLDGYPLYEHRKACLDILRGNKKDDTQFSMIYELDEGDDYRDKSNWLKCCPSLGQTVLESYMEEQITAADNQPSLLTGVLTKNFNVFCQSAETWLGTEYLDKVTQSVDIEQLAGEYCYGGIDLGATSDLTSFAACYPPNQNRKYHPDKYIFVTKNYVPESALKESINSNLYKIWQRDTSLTVTPGNTTDYDYILEDIINHNNGSPFVLIAYDAWNSTQFVIHATEKGLPMQPYSQSLGNFNKPTKFMEMLVRSGKCIIDKNTCTRWCFNNVVIKEDYNENQKPTKTTKQQKIDPIIAMIEALGGYLSEGNSDCEVV